MSLPLSTSNLTISNGMRKYKLITSMNLQVDVQRQGMNLIGVVTTLHKPFPTADHPLKSFTSISPSLLLTVPLELASKEQYDWLMKYFDVRQ